NYNRVARSVRSPLPLRKFFFNHENCFATVREEGSSAIVDAPCADGGGRTRIPRSEHARCAPDREWRGATRPARGGRSVAGVERIRRGRVPSCRAPCKHGGVARQASGVVRARTRAERSVAGRRTEGRARGAGLRSKARRLIASRAVARRSEATWHGASDRGRR